MLKTSPKKLKRSAFIILGDIAMASDKLLKCPVCKKIYKASRWEEDYGECELCCGPQPGVVCPNFFCGAIFTDCSSDYPEEVKT